MESLCIYGLVIALAILFANDAAVGTLPEVPSPRYVLSLEPSLTRWPVMYVMYETVSEASILVTVREATMLGEGGIVGPE